MDPSAGGQELPPGELGEPEIDFELGEEAQLGHAFADALAR
jgi:hypothetical protein